MGCNVGGHDGAVEMFQQIAATHNINIVIANMDVGYLSGGGEFNSSLTVQPPGFRWIRVNSDGTVTYHYPNGVSAPAPQAPGSPTTPSGAPSTPPDSPSAPPTPIQPTPSAPVSPRHGGEIER